MVLIGLGSNQGDTRAIIEAAIERLRCLAARGFHASSLWRTSPVDCPPGSAEFINAVVALEVPGDCSPESLLRTLKAMEREFGREEVPVRNAPRALDLDLLVFGTERRDHAEFVLPHPRAVDRLFVLAPAAEVAPELVWPGVGRTVQALLEEFTGDDVAERLSTS